jgi:YVTN family beta-propeller protein
MPHPIAFANLPQPQRRVRAAAILGTAFLFLPYLFPDKAFAQTGTLLAINEGESTLSIINPQSGLEIARVAEGGVAGHEVVASFDGRMAYVPIYGDSSAGDPGSNGSELVAIDVISHKVVGHVDFGHGVRPHEPLLNPYDGMLYVTTELDQTITVIDPKTMKIVGTIPTGQALSHMLTLDHEGRFGYTANIQPGSVSVLDMHARKLLTIIPISAKTQRIAISTDDKRVFTTDQTEPRVAVIDVASRQVRSWIQLPAIGYTLTTTQDGRWLLVGIQSTSQVAVIDLALNRVVRTIDLPKSPHEILMAPDGATAYVSCTAHEQIAAIRVSDWTVTRLIKAGTRVDGLAWAAEQQ